MLNDTDALTTLRESAHDVGAPADSFDTKCRAVHATDTRREIGPWADPAAMPLATFTEFEPLIDVEIPPSESLSKLQALCDARRPSSHIFYAFRLDGVFPLIRTEPTHDTKSAGLYPHAIRGNISVCELTDVSGTVVGLWSPGVSSVFSLPGYHFQFVSPGRRGTGHLVACISGTLRLRMEPLTDFIWHCLRTQSLQT
ncbi:acetolactate decarboxylase [Burkholderia pyrrocinia]|uniref:acetolactate decarboxylase n=1 Tax=Burkholderia pyrrocinia TaxID=60550 RepID=UPI00069D9BAD|nr:acetolactate decarboxylase [Burkholderia pyrrocinia]